MKLADIEAPAGRAAAGRMTTYYEQPAIKAPPWKWEVATYLFVSALSGGCQLVAAIANRFGGRKMRHVVRHGRFIALGGAAAGGALLIADLKTPHRWYNMLRILRRTSPMSIGTYTFGTFALSSLVTAFREWRSRTPGVATMAQVPAGIAAIGFMTYTGPLLSATSNPHWAPHPELRAASYGSSALALAASTLSLLERAGRRGHSARVLEDLALASASVHALVSLASRDPADMSTAREDTRSGERRLHRTATILSTIVPVCCYTIARLAPAGGRPFSMMASLSVIAGIGLSKWSDVSLGKRSADDPELYLRFTQPRSPDSSEERSR